MFLYSKDTFKNPNVLSILGGFIFIFVFFLGYTEINPNWYIHRDDGVITMSVAKNWVDYGFLGVSISGPIVEATSSPLQFFVYAFVYSIWNISYDNFGFWQTQIATFLLGAIFIRFFANKLWFAIICTVIAAFLLTYFYHFFQWHASGMENALTHVTFLATFYILYHAVKYKYINYWTAIVVFFAAVSRLDSVYHISILLVIFSVYWYFVYHDFKAFYFSLLVFLFWLILQLWRYYYFGDLLPNTAYAQNISVSDRLGLLWQLDRNYLRQSMNLGREIFLNQAGWLLVILPFILYYTNKTVQLWFATLLVFGIAITSYLNPFIFGATRLDHNRSTTQMILYVFLVVGLYFYHIKSNKVKIILLIIVTVPSLWYYTKLGYHPKPLCCNTKSFDKTRVKFEKIAEENNINLPTVSNPDLGVLSWHKKFNIVDIGRLGSPMMAHVKDDTELFKEYYLNYALPDIIELHNGWSCGYAFLLKDEKFNNLYKPLDATITKWTKNHCKEAPYSKSGIWIRRNMEYASSSNERKFLDILQTNLNMNSIKKELNTCYSNKSNLCQYISRVLYHVLPKIIEEKMYDEVFDLMLQHPINAYDIYLLSGYKEALRYKDALEYIQTNLAK